LQIQNGSTGKGKEQHSQQKRWIKKQPGEGVLLGVLANGPAEKKSRGRVAKIARVQKCAELR